MKKYAILLVLMLCFFESEGQQVYLSGGNICEGKNFDLVFEDNFNGPLDESDWYTYFPYGEGNSDQCSFCRTHDEQIPFGEGQVYLDDNVRIGGGSLFFDVKNEPATWYGQSKNYTSGMIHSKKYYGYGKYEIRCKIPDGYGHFPAFWAQDGNHEIDIFESWGPENGPTKKFLSSVHNYNVSTSDFWTKKGIDLSLDFHTYSVIYGQDMMFFYFDDDLVGMVPRYYTLDGDVVDCDISTGLYVTNPAYPPLGKQFRVIANAAVVGGPAANNEVPEGTMEIDYIRVYKFACDAPQESCNEINDNIAIIINEDTEWDQCDINNIGNQYEYIRVSNNSTLEINDSEIRMLLPGKIIVDAGSTLLLNNTTIQPCEEGTRWQGIYLENDASVKLKDGSAIKSSKLGIYNNLELYNQINSEGIMDVYSLNNDVSTIAGNNSVILNNSSLIDNYNSITLDGDDNLISLKQSTIEDSKQATVIRGNRNGYIEYRYVTFENNNISLFAKDCGDGHDIHNCTFTNSDPVSTQITLRKVDGLDFQMNTMDGPGHLFDAFDSYVDIVNDNHFLNSAHAIWIKGSYPTAAGARIGHLSTNAKANYFSGNTVGIRLNGLNSSVGGRISNNQLDNTNQIAIDVNGIGLSRITNNTIDNAEDGLYFSKTGVMINTINCNLFENNIHQDLTVELENSNSVFLQNDFSNSSNSGNIILHQAIIENEQGNDDNPADNCFHSSPSKNLYTDLSTAFFLYHHNEVIPCKIPSGNGNYQGLGTFAEADHCDEYGIGSNFVGSSHVPAVVHLTPHYGDLTPGIMGPNIHSELNHLISVGGDDPHTYPDESLPNTEVLPNVTYPSSYLSNIEEINTYESELDYWILAAIQYAIDHNDYQYGENLLIPFKKWRWQEMLYGLFVKSHQYTKARYHLNTLPSYTQYEGEFIALQHINLDRLVHGDQTITGEQIQVVHAIATGSTPAAGYAIPLYHILTEIRLQSQVPSKNSILRMDRTNEDQEELAIVPNPVKDQLTLLNKYNKKLGQIEIIDLYYNVRTRLSADNLDQVDISTLASGWYILKCVLDDKEYITLPFIKQ